MRGPRCPAAAPRASRVSLFAPRGPRRSRSNGPAGPTEPRGRRERRGAARSSRRAFLLRSGARAALGVGPGPPSPAGAAASRRLGAAPARPGRCLQGTLKIQPARVELRFAVCVGGFLRTSSPTHRPPPPPGLQFESKGVELLESVRSP